jgi:serine/threonine protein phosphatase 1
MSFTFAIGDIHGCHEQLQDLLRALEFRYDSGTVVFLGDYVDRGPDSRAVVERVMGGPAKAGWQWIALKGNHEEMMVDALRSGRSSSMWLANGGAETYDSYGGKVHDSVVAWMDSLPLIHIDPLRVFAHAGVEESAPLESQPPRTLLWSRPTAGQSGHYWGKHLCHGHTPAPENPATTGNRTNVDSGCVFGGTLTAAVFDDDRPGPPVRFISIPNTLAR